MLGSASQAEDILQEAYLRWQSSPEVRQPRAFLTRVVTNLCLDQLKSACQTREQYVGTWLPEPMATNDPEASALQKESLRFAFLRLLEDLNPRERAAYLLREVFGHGYDELAGFLEETEANSRQLVSRARKHLEARRGRYEPGPGQLEELLASFARAAEGEPEALLQRLHQDVTVWTDGGGKVNAALNPVQGRDKVTRMMAGLIRKGAATARLVPTILIKHTSRPNERYNQADFTSRQSLRFPQSSRAGTPRSMPGHSSNTRHCSSFSEGIALTVYLALKRTGT